MTSPENTLMVRHLPADLTGEEHVELLKLYGAVHVRSMGTTGRMRGTAFAAFPSPEVTEKALGKLHQLEILGSRLVVEFSKKRFIKYHPDSLIPDKKHEKDLKEKEKEEEAVNKEIEDRKKIATYMNKVCSRWELEYPMNPRLHYMYPPPTVSILTNIANALASVPKFYVQVLHLMNKMHLPAPFGAITQTPPIPEKEPSEILKENQRLKNNKQDKDVEGEPTDESEIESEGEEDGKPKTKKSLPVKRPRREGYTVRKKPKIQQIIAPPELPAKSKTTPQNPSEVFEQPDSVSTKKQGFKLPAAISEVLGHNREQQQVTQGGSAPSVEPPPVAPQVFKMPVQEPVNQVVPSRVEPPPATETPLTVSLPPIPEPIVPLPVVEEGGFGKIIPVTKETEEEESEEEEEEEWGAGEFISSRRLRRSRISHSEMKELNVFKNYKPGDPTSRLYIKNVAKQTTDKDLHYIYGRYVNWDKEEEKLLFDIRLMKEGRMKGQAFVTLPSQEAAQEALEDTNGFLMHSKPMVVQFARSAKPKGQDAQS